MHPGSLISLAAAAAAGALAGAINTIAGGGGFVVLPTLMAIGLSPQQANGTMRLGLVLQNVSAVITFERQGVRAWPTFGKLFGPVAIGAVGGAWLATRMPARLFRPVVGWAFIAWSVVLLLRPGRFVGRARGRDEAPSAEQTAPRAPLWSFPLSLLVGGYGGFLQAGVGLPLIALLVSGIGDAPVTANAAKVALVLSYTLLALPLFVSANQVAWLPGGGLALGMLVGAWVGVRLQVRGGAPLVRWVVLAMVLLSGLALLLRSGA